MLNKQFLLIIKDRGDKIMLNKQVLKLIQTGEEKMER